MKNVTQYIVIGLLAIAGGCASQQGDQKDFFPAEGQPRDMQRALDVQAARGARADAMLYDAHFDNQDLNSLGQAKLDLMLRDNERKLPVVVYLNFAGEQKSRRDSVETYLRESGVLAEQVRFEGGDNPKASASAADGIKALEAQKASEQPVDMAGMSGGGSSK